LLADPSESVNLYEEAETDPDLAIVRNELYNEVEKYVSRAALDTSQNNGRRVAAYKAWEETGYVTPWVPGYNNNDRSHVSSSYPDFCGTVGDLEDTDPSKFSNVRYWGSEA
jgi:hypothetical protein